MFRALCSSIVQSKNIIMLLTAGIYIFALYSVFSEHILSAAFFLSVIFVFSIVRNIFPLKYIIVWTLVFYFGVINTSFRLKDFDDLQNLAPVNSEITGTVISIPQGKAEGKIKFFFDTEKIEYGSVTKEFKNEKVLVMVNKMYNNPQEAYNLKLYSRAKLKGRLSVPFKAGNPSQFDYGNYLRNFNTYSVFYVKEVEILPSNNGLKENFLQGINDTRERILACHSKYLKSPNLEILGGIVFGDDAVSPPKEIKQSFINSGLLHILAASGMNVAFIYTFFFFIMSALRVNFKVNVLISMVMVIIYTLMTGLGASVIRAAAMLIFVLIGKLIDREAHSISLLSFVALLMLIYNPMYVNDVGFQLSFIVTFGILVAAPYIPRFQNGFMNFLVSTVSIPVIAQLWVIPIQIFYFNNISIYSVFANILSVPVLMVLSFGGFLSSLFASIPPIADFVCKITDFILNPLATYLVNISDFWGKLPNASLQTTHPAIFQIFLYYSILLLIIYLFNKDFREKYISLLKYAIPALILVLLLSCISIPNRNLEITAFDVGNADCFLIKTPKNKFIIIDTGKNGYNGGKSQAEIIVLKYLKDRGIKKADSIIVTHFDNDHCGGAADMIKGLKIGKVYVNNLHHKSNAAKDIYITAKKYNTPLILAQSGVPVYKEKDLEVVNFLNTDFDSDNDNSIITLLKYRDFTMLFTGDAGIKGIKALLNELPRDITVLKVPHHGAKGGLDKDIMLYLNPLYTVVSVGENKFGHPSPYIMYLISGTQVLRTDINNSVRFRVNNKGCKVLTYDNRLRRYRNKDFRY